MKLYLGVFIKVVRFLSPGTPDIKGSWLLMLLQSLGADIYGYALKAQTTPSLYELANVDQIVSYSIADIRDYKKLFTVLQQVKPEIVIHTAAQA